MSRPKIASIVNTYGPYDHGQHLTDRFLHGYAWDNKHHHPPFDLVALYVDQFNDDDVSRRRAKQYPSMKIYPSIKEAICCGGEKLAVEGIMVISEHGAYPVTEKGLTQWPRYEFFQQIVEVFKDSGRTAPIFNDKHLSWNWEWAVDMVETSRTMGFGFMAGSSLPVLRRVPSIELPLNADVEEVLGIGPGGPDSYAIHILEGMQGMVERRHGGENGVVSLQAIRGDDVWDTIQAGSWDAGGCDPSLLEACLCRAMHLNQPKDGFNHMYPKPSDFPNLVNHEPIAYHYEHADGLKATMLQVEGLCDFTLACRLKDRPDPLATMVYIAPRDGPCIFSPLAHHIETLFLTGVSPYPIERTLLTTGISNAGMESLWLGCTKIETPHLDVNYRSTQGSTFRHT